MNFLVAGGTTAAYLYSVVLVLLAVSTAQVCMRVPLASKQAGSTRLPLRLAVVVIVVVVFPR